MRAISGWSDSTDVVIDCLAAAIGVVGLSDGDSAAESNLVRFVVSVDMVVAVLILSSVTTTVKTPQQHNNASA